MSSASDRFIAEFGGDWDLKAALDASAAPCRLDSLAQPAEADDNVAANPAMPRLDADLKAKRDLDDAFAMHKMLEESDTEGSDSDGSFAYAAGHKAPEREPQAPGREPQGSEPQGDGTPSANLPPWRKWPHAMPQAPAMPSQVVPQAHAVPSQAMAQAPALPSQAMPQAPVPSQAPMLQAPVPETSGSQVSRLQEETAEEAEARARALALYRAAQNEIQQGASSSIPEDREAYDAVEDRLAQEHHVKWQDRGPRGENRPAVWRGQTWRNQFHSEKGGTGRYGNRGGDPAKNAYFAEQARKRQKSGKAASGHKGNKGKGTNMEHMEKGKAKGSGTNISEKGKAKGSGTNISDKGKGDRILVFIRVSCFLHLLDVRIVIWFCWSPSLQL